MAKVIIVVLLALSACQLTAGSTLSRLLDSLKNKQPPGIADRYAEINAKLCKRVRGTDAREILREANKLLAELEKNFPSQARKQRQSIYLRMALQRIVDVEQSVRAKTLCTSSALEAFELFSQQFAESSASKLDEKCPHLFVVKAYFDQLRVTNCPSEYLGRFNAIMKSLHPVLKDRLHGTVGRALDRLTGGTRALKLSSIETLHERLSAGAEVDMDLVKSIGEVIKLLIQAKHGAGKGADEVSRPQQVSIFNKYLLFPCRSYQDKFDDVFAQAKADLRLSSSGEQGSELREKLEEILGVGPFLEGWAFHEMCQWVETNSNKIKENIVSH